VARRFPLSRPALPEICQKTPCHGAPWPVKLKKQVVPARHARSGDFSGGPARPAGCSLPELNKNIYIFCNFLENLSHASLAFY
jgi:hypothetical protein